MAWLHSNRSIARPTKVKGRTLFGLGLLCGEIGKSEPRPEYANDQPDGENRTGRRTSPQSPFLPRRVTAATDVRLRDRGVYILAGIIEPAPARESRPGSQPPFDAIERGGHSRRTYRKNADAKRRAPGVLDLTALLPCRNLYSLPPSRRDPLPQREEMRILITPDRFDLQTNSRVTEAPCTTSYAARLEQLDQLGEIVQRTGRPVNFVDTVWTLPARMSATRCLSAGRSRLPPE